jgi:predicted phosphodiesterase
MTKGGRSQQWRLFRLVGSPALSFIVLASTLLLLASVKKPAQADFTFNFTAIGDYAETNYTNANLSYIAHQSGASFNLGLGDFDYTHTAAAQWSSYVTNSLRGIPFEIVAGNEDKRQLNTYIAALPDRIGNISGTYAKEYSFDYPPGSPLARFILVSPGGVVAGYNYSKGSPHYNWVSQQIDDARGRGISWIIVAMHEPCIYVNSTSFSGPCSSLDLLNLLVSKRVDLILYGHKHNFQASKQLAFNGTTCTSLTPGTYNSNCVVNSSTSLTKGTGSVMVINGTGGETPLMGTNSSDPNAGYFRTWEGGKTNATWGVSLITVSSSQLSVKFIGTSGSFSDSFTIA